MGAWGTSLYANDTACDIRGDYLDKLKRGYSNEQSTNDLMEANKDIFGDLEEEPLFWFALADTQWNYGRLLPAVKDRALFFLDREEELERWETEKERKGWTKTRELLREKITSEQPPIKRVSKYRFYKCKWNMGDIYAYQFSSDYSKEKDVYGQYVIFRKISETTEWPGHIIPVVQVYKWMGNDLPVYDEIIKLPLLNQEFYSKEILEKGKSTPIYSIKLAAPFANKVKKGSLTFLGNYKGMINEQFSDERYLWMLNTVGWEESKYNNKFEHYIIEQYFSWQEMDS